MTRPPCRPLVLVAALAAAVLVAVAAASAAAPTLQFRLLSKTGIGLTDVLWTGKQLLVVENTENKLHVVQPNGKLGAVFATMPKLTEETRCLLSPGAHGFPAGFIYCHAPDNKIYRISNDGSKVEVFATLPNTTIADGAMDFDRVGSFGFALVAATGRSGSGQKAGGTVYTVSAAGKVRTVGSYTQPGADELIVAPKGLGSASGQVLLACDGGNAGGVVAMDARGRSREIAKLDDGPNPIAAVTHGTGPRAGLYVVDTLSKNLYFLPAAQLARYAGKVIVGSELKAHFWVLEPSGNGFKTTRIATNLRGEKYNLEGGRVLP